MYVLDSKMQIICDTTRYHVISVVKLNGEGSVECLSVDQPTWRVHGHLRAELCPSACRVCYSRLAHLSWWFCCMGFKYRELNIDSVICPLFIKITFSKNFLLPQSI